MKNLVPCSFLVLALTIPGSDAEEVKVTVLSASGSLSTSQYCQESPSADMQFCGLGEDVQPDYCQDASCGSELLAAGWNVLTEFGDASEDSDRFGVTSTPSKYVNSNDGFQTAGWLPSKEADCQSHIQLQSNPLYAPPVEIKNHRYCFGKYMREFHYQSECSGSITKTLVQQSSPLRLVVAFSSPSFGVCDLVITDGNGVETIVPADQVQCPSASEGEKATVRVDASLVTVHMQTVDLAAGDGSIAVREGYPSSTSECFVAYVLTKGLE